MSFEFHLNKDKYFKQQYLVTKDFIIPFLRDYFKDYKNLNILEIGCAHAGVLKAFINDGCSKCVGIELSKQLIDKATSLMSAELKDKKIEFINKNIYDIADSDNLIGRFDLIIIKDVIEHIEDQQRFIFQIKKLLKTEGKVFFAFPPWQMPFGGHQQMCENKILSLIPFIHLLPLNIYILILKMFNESREVIDELLNVKKLGISIERFESIIKKADLKILKKNFYFINPIYKYKFNLKPKRQLWVISIIPWLRNFFTTSVYYVVGK